MTDCQASIICQPDSWGSLAVSRPLFEAFVAHTNAIDGIWDTVLFFRNRTCDLEDGFSVCAWSMVENTCELTYIFKYAEQKKSHNEEIKWVIRKMGIYHKFCAGSNRNVWLLIYPEPVTSHEEVMFNFTSAIHHPLYPHVSFLSGRAQKWRWYLEDLEEQFREHARCVLNVEIEERLRFVEMYEELSALRFVASSLAPLIPILASYHQVLRRLETMNQHLHRYDHIGEKESREFSTLIGNMEDRVQSFELNTKHLLSRVASTIQMASDTISLKNQNTAEDVSAHLLKDSLTMRIITLVTLLFLPGTFVAGFFGMSFFDTDDSAGGEWTTSKNLWIYFVLTIPLTAMALAYWKWKFGQERTRRNETLPV
ncbi:hypothetical protein GGS24DRAFT_495100 [Hypoxylon argillaceum]|nr:hypothetical protein GGS24DRAFT_495100 [Hypoxylon argillaceum]